MKNFISKNWAIIYKILRFFIFLSPIILLGYLIYRDFVPSGVISFNYDIKHHSPVITQLFPVNRLTDPIKDSDGRYYQEIIKEPVYFETRLSQRFERAEVEILFQNPQSNLFQLGLAVGEASSWNYFLRPLGNQDLDNLSWSKIEENNLTLWQSATLSFDLKDAQIVNRKLRWLLSTPSANDQLEKIKIKNIKITFYKQPITWRELAPKIFQYLKKFF